MSSNKSESKSKIWQLELANKNMELEIDALTKTVSKLKNSEQLLTNVVDYAPIGMVTLTIKGKFKTVNKTFCQITGYTKKELLTKNISQITHPDDKYIGDNVIEELKSGKAKKAYFEKRYIHKNGNYIYTQVSTVILRDELGAPQKFFTQVIDITAYKKYQESIIKSEQKFKALVESARDGIIVIQNDVIKFANPHASEIYGVSLSNVMGQSFLKFVHPDSVEMIKKRYAAWKNGKTVPNEFEVDLINSNKEKRTCEIHSSTTVFEDQNVELVIIRDITDVKQMEAALRYRVELERLVTGISTHFINLAPDEVDSGINRVLQEIGEFVNVDRSYVFLFYDNGMKMDNTHEWCAEGIEPQIDNLQGLPAETLPWWMERLNRFENIHIPSVADLPPKANAEKEILQAQGIKSLIVVPIIYGRSLFGFLGFDSVQGEKTWSEDIIALLRLVGEVIANALERKQAEKKLKESERRLALAVEGAGLGLWDQDFSSGKTIRNERWAQMLGYELDEIEQSRSAWKELIHPDDLATLEKSIKEHKQGKSSLYSVEHRMRAKNGEWKWIHNWGRIVERDKNGRPLRALGVHLDITDRKRAEEALLESELKYRKFFMEDLTGDYLSTREGKMIVCNPQFLKIFGFKSLKEAQDYDAYKFYKSNSEREEFIKRLEKNRNLVHKQKENYKVNGEKIIIHENVFGEFDDDGKLINIRGYIYDVTKRVKAELEVVKLSSAVEQSPVSIIITDTDGIIEYVNPTFENLTGYSLDEAIGSKPSILKSGVNPDSEYRKLWKTITAGKVWAGEFRNKKKNGELYWESATISPILDNNNNIIHFLAVKEDITEKKKFITDLMEREEKYRTLTQNLNVGVYRSTPGKNGIFIEANPAFLKMFEFRSKKELERWKVVDFYSDPLDRENIEEKLRSKGFLINEEVELRKKDGTIFSASISATVAKDDSGKVIHYDGIIEDCTEEHKARKDILNYQSNLKSLTNELIITEERAKRRLAMTLHDKLGQSLVLAKFKTDELNKKTTDSEDKKIINEITSSLEEAIDESRNITYELSPPVLYEMGLIPAVSYKLDEIEKNNRIKTSLIDQSKLYELDEKEQIILYRSINELLQNVLKHSKAENVNISFRLLTNDYRITISDDGIGFDLEAMRDKAVSQKKFGLFSIMERIKYIGGRVEIDTTPEKGTEVVIDLPIKN